VFRHQSLALPALALAACELFTIASPAGTPRGSAASGHALLPDRFDLLTGQYWRQITDPGHPAAPPRLIAMKESEAPDRPLHRPHVMCVKAGEHVLLESEGEQSIVRMDATALENGAAGDRVRARISVTGAEVEVTVLDAHSGILVRPTLNPGLRPLRGQP